MKYDYKRLDISTYITSLYQDGFKTSTTYTNEKIVALILDIGLFKFKGYIKAFRTNISDYSIDDVINLYTADREVSLNMFALSSKVEIKLKSHLIELVYELTNNPFFYLLKESYMEDFSLNGESTGDWEVKTPHPQQKTEIYQHYRDYYLTKYDFEDNEKEYLYHQELIELKDKNINYPPFHYFVENMTLGSLITMLSKLIINDKKILNLLGKRFNIQDSKVFLHYLLRLKELRNRCAHNGRIFNRNYRGVKAFAKHKNYREAIYEHKLIDVYYTLCYLLKLADNFKTVENLVMRFKEDVFLNCDESSSEFMIGIMKTR